jgi:hypothetical protein
VYEGRKEGRKEIWKEVKEGRGDPLHANSLLPVRRKEGRTEGKMEGNEGRKERTETS